MALVVSYRLTVDSSNFGRMDIELESEDVFEAGLALIGQVLSQTRCRIGAVEHGDGWVAVQVKLGGGERLKSDEAEVVEILKALKASQ